MGLKGRIRKIEERRRGRPNPPCEECGGVIITEEIAEDGTVTYPDRKPCPVCGSRGSAGQIGRIVVDMRRREGETGRGDVYQIENFPDQ